jgi:hypothetical protein
MIFAAITQTPPEATAGSITYNIVAYPTITSPYSVSGTITTNGATGTALDGTDITGWDITVTQGTTPIFELTPTNSDNITSIFDATATTITVPTTSGQSIQFATTDIPSSQDINWLRNDDNTITYLGTDVSILPFGQSIWNGLLPTNQSPVATATAIPEPSTGVLVGIGAVHALPYVQHRKRQSRHARGDVGRSEPAE